MSTGRVAVVILNYNGVKFLQDFLPSVVAYSSPHRIIVADNASSDDSVSFLKEHFPGVEIIELEENTGFAGGYNNALKRIEAEYYCLLNSDVEVTENWLEPLISYLDTHQNIASVQPKIRAFHQKEAFEYAGAAGGFIDYLGYPFCHGRLFFQTEKDSGQYEKPKNVFWTSGACMLIRSKLFHEAGGFDQQFFAHMEEIDLCWRLQHAGYQLAYVPDSVVYHVGGGTLSKSNPRKTYLNFRNGLSILYKNLSNKELSKILPTRILLDFLASIKFLVLDGSLADCKAVWKAHRDYWKGRKKLSPSPSLKRPFRELEGISHKSVVWQFFVLGRKKASDFFNA